MLYHQRTRRDLLNSIVAQLKTGWFISDSCSGTTDVFGSISQYQAPIEVLSDMMVSTTKRKAVISNSMFVLNINRGRVPLVLWFASTCPQPGAHTTTTAVMSLHARLLLPVRTTYGSIRSTLYLLRHRMVDGFRQAITSVRRRSKAFRSACNGRYRTGV